jgi:hypothetical protein
VTAARIEARNDRLVAWHRDRVLYEYVFRPRLPVELAPRPYFHPVRSLGGTIVTEHQPADHRWHLGLAYSWPVVNELNFWGGPSFRREQGYIQLANNGEIAHAELRDGMEALCWIDPAGSLVAREERYIGAPVVHGDAWLMTLSTEIENRLAGPLRVGSPTTEGRPMAGYAGLAWRGPNTLHGAAVILEDGAVRGDAMGLRSRWLAVAADEVTVAFADESGARPPARWFVRTDPYVLVSASPLFDESITLAPGERLRLRHRLLVADGRWDAAHLDAALS